MAITSDHRHRLGLAATLLFLTGSVWGQQNQATTRIDETQIEQSARRAADAWDLNQQEYERYESIMEGPRGIWSPNLDPLTALGLEASTEAERQKYAEQLVEMERARVEAELAFQRAYDAAWQRLHPEAMPVTPFTMKGGEDGLQSVFGSNPSDSGQRMNVVVAIESCSQCDAAVRQLLRTGAAMDIWVVDSDGDDGRIREWAAAQGIPPEKVRAGHVTLNHGGSLNVSTDDLPRVAPRG